jgi:hypothetical protein
MQLVIAIIVGGMSLLVDHINGIWGYSVFGNPFTEGMLLCLLSFGLYNGLSDIITDIRFNWKFKKRK